MYSLSPTNQIWLCQVLERHYRFSGDRSFLEEKVYPYMSETAETFLGIMVLRDGKYYLPISSSPELHDDNIESFLTPNSNYDLSMMRYLFGTLRDLAKELDNGETEKWEEIFARLPELAVNDRNVLMIAPDESLEESHRHLAHLMSIHPLRILKYDTEEHKKIINSSLIDMERLGTGYWCGYTFPWAAELFAIAKNGNAAAYQLRAGIETTFSQNGFHLNGDYKHCGTAIYHYRPFTLEGNMCVADAIQEMLLYTEDGQIEVFPAIPDCWKEGEVSFENLRAEKGLLVSAKMVDGKLQFVTFAASQDTTICFVNGKQNLTIAKNTQKTIVL